jgi:hypothetical protein
MRHSDHSDIRALWRSRLTNQQSSGLSTYTWYSAKWYRRNLYYCLRDKIFIYDSSIGVPSIDNLSDKNNIKSVLPKDVSHVL